MLDPARSIKVACDEQMGVDLELIGERYYSLVMS